MKKLLFLLLGLVIITTACQTNTELTDADKDAMVQAVKQASQESFDLMNEPYEKSGTQEKYEKYNDQNATEIWQTEPVWMTFGVNIVKSINESRDMFKSIRDRRISTTFSILESHYAVLSKDRVLEVLKTEYFVTRKDSTVGSPMIGLHSNIWANIDGEWKTQYSHQSWARKPE